MTVFINKQEVTSHFFEEPHFSQEMQRRHQQAREQNLACLGFLEKLKESDPARAEELYVRVAAVWKQLSGGMSSQGEGELGKRLADHHIDDPFVAQTVIRFMEGGEGNPELPCFLVEEISQNTKKIISADSFETECTIYSLPGASEKAQKHTEAAFRALNFAARHIPFSGNYSRINTDDPDSEMTSKMISERTEELQDKCINKCSAEYLLAMKGLCPNSFMCMLRRNQILEKYIIGNCSELSAVVFFYLLKEKQTDMKIDIFSIKKGDHIFVVIGRTPGSNFRLRETWGPDAVVCDPWARTIYPASQIPTLLNDFIGGDDLYRPQLQRFNPDTQSLSVITSNMGNALDFSKRLNQIPEIEDSLTEFHAIPIQDQAGKMRQAAKIIQAIKELGASTWLLNRTLHERLSQMQYFMGVPELGRIIDPFYDALKKAELTNDPLLFQNAIQEESWYSPYVIDFGLCLAKKTGNLDFLKKAISLNIKPSEETLQFASWIAAKTKNPDYLRLVEEAVKNFNITIS